MAYDFDPAADSVPPLFAAGAIARIVGAKGVRDVPVEQVVIEKATVVAAEEGWAVTYLGPDLPARDIATAAQLRGALLQFFQHGVFRLGDGEAVAHQLGLLRVGLDVEAGEVGGAQPRHDQVAPLDMRVRRVRAQAGRAGVPAEMVQLVARRRHVGLTHDTAIVRRRGIDVDHADRIRLVL